MFGAAHGVCGFDQGFFERSCTAIVKIRSGIEEAAQGRGIELVRFKFSDTQLVELVFEGCACADIVVVAIGKFGAAVTGFAPYVWVRKNVFATLLCRCKSLGTQMGIGGCREAVLKRQ